MYRAMISLLEVRLRLGMITYCPLGSGQMTGVPASYTLVNLCNDIGPIAER